MKNGFLLIMRHSAGYLQGNIHQILDVSALAGGVYSLKIIRGDAIEERKVVLE